MNSSLSILLTSLGLFFVLFHSTSFGEDSAPPSSSSSGTLEIQLIGFSNDKGLAQIAIANSKETFVNSEESKPYRSGSVPIQSKNASWVVSDLPYGSYAISVFHDENSDGKLDTGLFGIPTEDYGFSNNPAATFGPPSFQAAKIVLDQKNLKIEIDLD